MSAGGKGQSGSGDSRLLILTIVMLTMNGGQLAPTIQSTSPWLYKWTTWIERKKSFSASYLKGCQIFFFFFCRVNPNLKDLKPTFALKTESLFVFFGWRGGKKNKIPQRYFLPFCTRKLPPPSVETIFVSNFSHLSTRRQVSWGKAADPADNGGGTGAACSGLGLSSLQEQFANCS